MIDQFDARFRNNAEHREWLFNFDKRRMKTYEEMVAQRDRYIDEDSGKYMTVEGLEEVDPEVIARQVRERKRRE